MFAWQVVEERYDENLASEDAVATTLKRQHVWDAGYVDAAVLRIRYDEPTQAESDRLYHVRGANQAVGALVDASTGGVVERVLHKPYGRPTVLNGAQDASDPAVAYGEWTKDADGKSDWDNQVLWCGYRHDPETGLYHARHRMYHPTLSRWLSRDPLGYIDGPNLYGYCGNHPGGATDPWGLRGWIRSQHDWQSGTFVEIGCTAGQTVAEMQYLNVNGVQYLKYCGNYYPFSVVQGWVSSKRSFGVDQLDSFLIFTRAVPGPRENEGRRFERVLGNMKAGSWSFDDWLWLSACYLPEHVADMDPETLRAACIAAEALEIAKIVRVYNRIFGTCVNEGDVFAHADKLALYISAIHTELSAGRNYQGRRSDDRWRDADEIAEMADRGLLRIAGLLDGALGDVWASMDPEYLQAWAKGFIAVSSSRALFDGIKPTLDRIRRGERHPHPNDGTLFKNKEGILPEHEYGYYREYVHPTPGVKGPGKRRIILGKGGEIYYSPEHYQGKIIRVLEPD